MYAVTRKLRALKPVFRTLRRKKGDLSLIIKLAAEFLGTVQNLLQTHRHNALLIRLEQCCKLVFLKATKLEQIMLQQSAKIQWLKGGDQCSRIFSQKVAMRRASKQVFQIMDEDGRIHTTREEVANEFVSFYQRLLGDDRRQEFIDLRYLRPWARHVLTPEECRVLVQLLSGEEIKDVFFDIAEDKALGPDGYSSGFYKAAWSIIGEELAPSMVSDFRPISCCNVLYKVITKIIVHRLRLVLDSLISSSQNAFVPGRSIGDNILLAGELFTRYNRQGLPMRCALKVDLRKAYDTVEWDFLIVVLHMFGFLSTFISWIEECVTTPMFSVCINGNPHGFFKGARGLRQGDPMSPFLFVLVMEVLQLMLQQLIEQNEGFSFHWRCKELGLFQLCFADDLLLFCRADVASVTVFERGWTNLQNYLGGPAAAKVPQTSSLSFDFIKSNCQPFLLKIDSRIKSWESIQLSFAKRLQLIKSVLMSLNVYWAMAFILPKGIIREIEKRIRSFLWKGNSSVGYPKVAWKVVCRGIRDILALNKALMSRHLWNVIQNNQSSIWVKWIVHTRLRHKSVWTVDEKGGSSWWRKLIRLRSALLPHIEFKIGDGESFSLWHDPWHSLDPLINRFPRGPGLTNTSLSAKPSLVIAEGKWRWPPITDMECLEIIHLLPSIHNGNDYIQWRGCTFTTKIAYDIFRSPGPKVRWYSLLSGPCKIPSVLSLDSVSERDEIRFGLCGQTVHGGWILYGLRGDGQDDT
ncbi:UNVERIFIED_CONTAM: Retrovirus-related Pol polyprotein from type-1 retrotransposable element R2 [Sesamum radiatum]|uniref:Retrovirus-related Pol polyprotein from type-1 retrotransposable element R2 n=1 Tax=Sesamum radiatum TaxID=300843 RepID=A0AAW2JGT0_SESRA